MAAAETPKPDNEAPQGLPDGANGGKDYADLMRKMNEFDPTGGGQKAISRIDEKVVGPDGPIQGMRNSLELKEQKGKEKPTPEDRKEAGENLSQVMTILNSRLEELREKAGRGEEVTEKDINDAASGALQGSGVWQGGYQGDSLLREAKNFLRAGLEE